MISTERFVDPAKIKPTESVEECRFYYDSFAYDPVKIRVSADSQAEAEE